MPIYAYRCESCGHTMDALQKVSDAPLVDCPACGKATLRKQVTAAGFQLKGSGWYVTDFRGDASKGAAKKDGAPADAAAAPKPDAPAAEPANNAAKNEAKKEAKSAAEPAPAPTPPSSTPSTS